MNIIIVLPPFSQSTDAILSNGLLTAKCHFGKKANIRVISSNEDRLSYLENSNIIDESVFATSFKDLSALVFLEGRNGEVLTTPQGAVTICGIYRIDFFRFRIWHVAGPNDLFKWPERTANRFNELAFGENDLSPSRWYYFPTGYLARELGDGPRDAFGFRNTVDFTTLHDRPTDHKVIAVFGGSGAYSTSTIYETCFSHGIEERLRAQLSGKVTVLNFGQPSSTCLHEIITYQTFCMGVKPDVVIAHTGFNDMTMGIEGCDPGLQRDYHFYYNHVLEEWARLIHNVSDDIRITPEPGGLSPQDLVYSFTLRADQFRTIAEANGGLYIQALQPWLLSKKNYHPDEANRLKTAHPNHRNPMFQNGMKILYQALDARLSEMNFTTFINFDRIFSAYSAKDDLFTDIVHCNADGDKIIAETYTDKLCSLLLSCQTNN